MAKESEESGPSLGSAWFLNARNSERADWGNVSGSEPRFPSDFAREGTAAGRGAGSQSCLLYRR